MKLNILLVISFLLVIECLNSQEVNASDQFIFFDDVLVQYSTGIPALKRMWPENLQSPVDYTK